MTGSKSLKNMTFAEILAEFRKWNDENRVTHFSYRGVALTQTCFGCPEQYDAYDAEGRQIGYLRLRHGFFTVEHPHCGGTLVFEARPMGDGSFDNDEREAYLKAAIDALIVATTSEVRTQGM